MRVKISLSQVVPLSLALSSLAIAGYAVVQGSLAVLIAYLLFGLTGLVLVWRGGRDSIGLFSLGYAVACISSVVLYVIYLQRWGVPYYIGGSDDANYDRYATLVAQHIAFYDHEAIGRLIQRIYHNSIGYIYLVSLLVRFGEMFGGYDTMLPRLLNAAVLGLSAVLVKRIAIQIGLNAREAVTAGLWVIFFPMMLYTAVHVFRDIATLFLLLIALHTSLAISTDQGKFFRLRWVIYSIPVLFVILVMAQFRVQYVIPVIVMLLSAWAFRVVPLTNIRLWHGVFLLPILFVLSLLATQLETIINALELLDHYGESLAGGYNSAPDGLAAKLFSLPQPIQTFARIGYALVTPLPIWYKEIESNLLGVGTLVQFYYAAFVLLGIKLIYRNTRMYPLLFGFVIVAFAYVLGTFTFRHITQWFPFAVLIGLVGYSRYKINLPHIFIVCSVLLGLAAIAYLSLKTF